MNHILLHTMAIFSLLSFLISMRLTLIFRKLKKNTLNKQVIPLANVMFAKSFIFTVMSLAIVFELCTIKIFPSFIDGIEVHWFFGSFFVILLFISQLYLYWLAEIRNGWH